MSWVADVHWESVRRRFDGVEVDISERAELDAKVPTFTARRFSLSVRWPEAVAWIAEGRGVDRAVVTLTDPAGRNAGTYAIQSAEVGNGGQTVTLEAANVPDRRGSILPPELEMTANRRDERRTAIAQETADAQVALIMAESTPAFIRKNQEQIEATRAAMSATVFSPVTEGLLLPLVVGQPGRIADNTGTTLRATTPAIRCIVLDESAGRLVIAGHPLPRGTEIIMWAVSSTGSSLPAKYAVDDTVTTTSGRRVATVLITPSSVLGGTHISWDPGLTWYAAMPPATHGISGDPVDLMLYLCRQVEGLRIDAASFEGLRHRLRGWYFDGVIDQRVPAFEVLERDIVPMLPVALVEGPKGLGARYVSMTVDRKRDPTVALVVGRTIRSIGESTKAARKRGQRPNLVRVSCRYNAHTRAFGEVRQAAPDGSRLGEIAVRRHGLTAWDLPASSSAWIYDPELASVVAGQVQARVALDRPSYTYEAAIDAHGVEGRRPLRLGDAVTLTDPDRAVAGALGIVTGVRRRNRSLRVTVTLAEPGLR